MTIIIIIKMKMIRQIKQTWHQQKPRMVGFNCRKNIQIRFFGIIYSSFIFIIFFFLKTLVSPACSGINIAWMDEFMQVSSFIQMLMFLLPCFPWVYAVFCFDTDVSSALYAFDELCRFLLSMLKLVMLLLLIYNHLNPVAGSTFRLTPYDPAADMRGAWLQNWLYCNSHVPARWNKKHLFNLKGSWKFFPR